MSDSSTLEMFTITVDSRTITARRPAHGELDVGMLLRLLQVLAGYQQKIRIVEEAGGSGGAIKVANYIGLCNEAVDEIVSRLRRFLGAVAGAEALAWFVAGTEAEVAGRAGEVAIALIDALAPPRLLPK